MGLDMYAMTTDEKLDRAVDFIPEQANEIFYWRKHPNLHGWMEKLYYEKGGSSDCFNCAPVVLTSEDLDRLEAAVKGGNLPHTTGFFFGVSEGREAEDLAFIAKAREAAQLEQEQLMSQLKREFGRMVSDATSRVTGKVLNTDDQTRINQETAAQVSA